MVWKEMIEFEEVKWRVFENVPSNCDNSQVTFIPKCIFLQRVNFANFTEGTTSLEVDFKNPDTSYISSLY